MKESKLPILLGVLMILLCLWSCFRNLGSHSISVRSDEIVYVRVVQEMLHSNAWWHLRHGHVPFYNKPPLKMWLAAVPVWLMGESNFSYRFMDALCGVLFICFAMWSGRRLGGSMLSGALTGLVLLGSQILFSGANSFRKAVLDGMLVLLVSIGTINGFYMCEAAPDRGKMRRFGMWLGVFSGLSVLVKSVAGLLPLVIVAAFLGISSRRKLLLKNCTRYLVMAVFIALGLGAIYYLPHSIESRVARETFFFTEIFDRAFQGFRSHNVDQPFYFLKILFRQGAAMPGWLLVLGLAAGCWRARRDERFRFLLVWAVLPVVLYSLSRSRLGWYIAPAFLALAILTASALESIGRYAWLGVTARKGLSNAVMGIGAACVFGLALWDLGSAYHRIHQYIGRSESTRMPIDLAVEDMKRWPEAKIVNYRRALSGRANPENGRFNFDGFYRGMVQERLIDAREPEDAARAREQNAGFIVVAHDEVCNMPPGVTAYMLLPPFYGRTQELVVLAYGPYYLPHFVHGTPPDGLREE